MVCQMAGFLERGYASSTLAFVAHHPCAPRMKYLPRFTRNFSHSCRGKCSSPMEHMGHESTTGLGESAKFLPLSRGS